MILALLMYIQMSLLSAASPNAETVSVSSVASLTVGQVIPSFNGQTTAGQRLSSRDILNQGVPVIITYAATWCEPCRKGLPIIQEVVQGEDKARLAIIALDKEPMKVRKWSRDLGLTSPIVVDKFNAVAKRHGIVEDDTPIEIPITIVANQTGQIIEIFTSEGGDFQDRLQQAIEIAAESSLKPLEKPVRQSK